MISGRIAESGLAWIPVSVQAGSGDWQQFSIAIDTGFTGEVALPERYLRQLRVTLDDAAIVTPATGPPVRVFAGHILIMWQGHRRQVRVVQAGTQPLLGMSLLWNNHIAIAAITDGAVTITPLGG